MAKANTISKPNACVDCSDKDLAFLKKSDSWTSEKHYNLRSSSVLKASYRTDGASKYGPNNCLVCKDNELLEPQLKETRKMLLKAILVTLTALILYWVLVKPTPYCVGHADANFAVKLGDNFEANETVSHCNYNDRIFKFFETCKPCPRNAICAGTQMVSKRNI